uniref:G-protein coupled receptors family 1 profile domain-containing protein n=1 Tax=Setaria digitata TaxID=48799 RepID=A0A915Q7R9_9BILA
MTTERNVTNSLGTAKYERSVLIQAALTCGVLEIGIITVNFLPQLLLKIFGGKAEIPVNIFVNSYLILSHGVLPIIYFMCNKQARGTITSLSVRLRDRIPKIA